MPNSAFSLRPLKFSPEGLKSVARRAKLRELREQYRRLPYEPCPGGKVCVACEKQLPIQMFSCSVVEGRHYYHGRCIRCRSFLNTRSSTGKAKRDLINTLLDKKCADCYGYFPAVAMRFYPVKGKPKFCISTAWTGRSNRSILEEAKKCEIVCANCASIRRAKDTTRRGRRYSKLAGLPPELHARVDLAARLAELSPRDPPASKPLILADLQPV